ncbi:MAG: 3'-5' exonuclease [Gemmatirosa sp.]|nr:3'-5' exonuclease [Gemmatirosa sp.]
MSSSSSAASRGVTTRPVDTLLVERARDYLAAGPATSGALVASVCQIPGLPEPLAERVAVELLGAFPEFRQSTDGRWTLAAGVSTREVGRPADAPARVPSFDEWRAAREAGETAEPLSPSPIVRQSSRGRRRPVRQSAEPAGAAPGPGPDDATPLTELSYVVVDVETTGGAPSRGHRITEIAAVVVRGGEVREVYETLVNPERVIPPEIVRLTGITAEMVRDKPRFPEVCEEVVAALGGHVFVAHNVGFDWRFVTAEVERASGRRLEGPRLCTVRLARKILPQLRSRSLGHVADFYGADAFAQTYFEARHGRDRPWRHSAAGDAVATAHCLIRLLRDAADRGITRWGELDLWLAGGTGRARRRRRSALPTPIDKDTTA